MADDTGDLLWISDGLSGSTRDLTAPRQHGIVDAAVRNGLQFCADRATRAQERARR
ncbi:hypothetical protein [Catellatospora sp. NPDC049609]|uniref:hypothetical protein n=1 Tax=Catellatospora sp. NPDC049609 TaxID=3155505 RepID=UPI0034466F1F